MNRFEVLLLYILEMHSTLLVCQDDTCTLEPWTLASLDHFRTCPHKERHLHSQDLVSSVSSSWQTSAVVKLGLRKLRVHQTFPGNLALKQTLTDYWHIYKLQYLVVVGGLWVLSSICNNSVANK